jgi:hypothetical protein
MRWRRRRESERDLKRELRSHLKLKAQEREADGLPSDQERFAAQRAFGNMTLVQEEIREMSGPKSLKRALQYLFPTQTSSTGRGRQGCLRTSRRISISV